MRSWSGRTAVVLTLVAVLSFTFAHPVAAVTYPENDAALAWLRQSQEPDGGFSSGFAEGSDFGTTAEVIMAVAAAGRDVSTWETVEGASPLDYMVSVVATDGISDVGDISKALLVVVATGQDPRDFGGADLVDQLLASRDETTGRFGDTLFKHAYAVLALHNAGAPVPPSAVTAMTSQMTEDGGWALFGGTTPGTADTNTTALIMQALVAVGRSDAAAAALPYLRRMQNEDGGFPYQKPSTWGTETDANSTAVVLQALYALDEQLSEWAGSGTDPLGALLALWNEESGAYLWQASTSAPNMLATAQAIQATERMTLVDVATVGATNLPQAQVQLAQPTTTEDAAPLLPASGGWLHSLLLVAAGFVMLGAGWTLRRR